MIDTYLPIKESIGYKNVKKALMEVFSIDLDSISIREGEDENFAFDLTYHSVLINIVITATGKKQQFETGAGGLVNIFLPDPDYPEVSFLEKQSLERVFKDKEIQKKLRYIFGKREGEVIFAFKLLKDFLDSDEAKPLLEKKSVILEPESIDIIEVVDGHLELLLTDSKVWSEFTEQDHLLELQEKLNNYIHYIETKQYVEKYGDDFDKKVINMTFQYSPSDNGRDFLAQVQEILQPTDISLKVVLPE